MKIECINDIDPITNDKIDNCWITLGKEYLVISMDASINGPIRFMIIANYGSRVVFDSSLFKATCPKIPSNWICKFNDEYILMGPEKWLDNSLWEYSFWESYDSLTCPEAEKVFKEELEKMIAEVG
ncbi:MAG: hypothetical protein J0H68_05830 [Sphingobacteriia bacterium]|nr:hypothetical protein [Sphingobacteriia bacterium]